MQRYARSSARFNRDIVECKVQHGLLSGVHGKADLIETLWNVKTESRQETGSTESGFNRDIVECKVLDGLFSRPLNQRFNRDIVECKDRALNIAVTSREGRVSRNSAIRFAA